MIVTDTNVISYFFMDKSSLASSVRERDPLWTAPALWRSEMRSVLIGYIRQGSVTFSEATTVMAEAESLMHGREHSVNSKHVLQLSADSGCTPYDCEFVSLAEQLGSLLVTSDKQLLSGFPAIAISMTDFLAS